MEIRSQRAAIFLLLGLVVVVVTVQIIASVYVTADTILKARRSRLAAAECGTVYTPEVVGMKVKLQPTEVQSIARTQQVLFNVTSEKGKTMGQLGVNTDYVQDDVEWHDMHGTIISQSGDVLHPDEHSHLLKVFDCHEEVIALVSLSESDEPGKIHISIMDPAGTEAASAKDANPYTFKLLDETGKVMSEISILDAFHPKIWFNQDSVRDNLGADARVLLILIGHNDLLHEFGSSYEWHPFWTKTLMMVGAVFWVLSCCLYICPHLLGLRGNTGCLAVALAFICTILLGFIVFGIFYLILNSTVVPHFRIDLFQWLGIKDW